MARERLDVVIQRRHPEYSRALIQSLIMLGRVKVDGIVATKPGTMTANNALIEIEEHAKPRYVSRAGTKLEKALQIFSINVQGKIALDAGVSTGGFTDCLLQHGIAKVYGVDVGRGQVHEKIRNDPRVILHEKTNLRYLRTVGEKVDLITLDLSFISVLKVLDAVRSLLKEGGDLIVLIKPQFEAERKDIGRGGIVRNSAVHERVIHHITAAMINAGFIQKGLVESPITGTDGNKEFLAYFVYQNCTEPSN